MIDSHVFHYIRREKEMKGHNRMHRLCAAVYSPCLYLIPILALYTGACADYHNQRQERKEVKIMDCKTEIVDVRKTPADEQAQRKIIDSLVWKLNNTQPRTEEYSRVQAELFGNNIGENSMVIAPLHGVCFERIKIGKNVFINSNLLAMARGGIEIGDNVQIAANVQLITNNHDMYDRQILICKPVRICDGAWIGAGATILPGIEVGKHAVVGAGAVVTRDVPDYAVAVGNPARVIKMLDPDKFSG